MILTLNLKSLCLVPQSVFKKINVDLLQLALEFRHSLVDLIACSNFDASFDKTDHVFILIKEQMETDIVKRKIIFTIILS